jgi:endonuclease III
MASSSRGSQFAKIHKVLKKQSYEVVSPDPERPLLEHLLFSACLENAHYDAAEQAFAALAHNFFDWNEIRVSTIRELAEVMPGLPDPAAAANRVKRILHSIFESTYSFDIEALRKQNLGPAIERLKELDGTTSFTVAYVVQSALGGHAIPIDAGALRVFQILDMVTDKNIEAREVPGLERAIAKSKGLEFASLLHQLGADLIANPYSPVVREILLQIDPNIRDRLPKRRTRKQAEAEKAKAAKDKTEKREQGKAKGISQTKKKQETEGGQSRAGKGKSRGRKQKETSPQTGGSEKKSKPAATKKKPTEKKNPADRTAAKNPGKKKSAASGLSKKKPR